MLKSFSKEKPVQRVEIKDVVKIELPFVRRAANGKSEVVMCSLSIGPENVTSIVETGKDGHVARDTCRRLTELALQKIRAVVL